MIFQSGDIAEQTQKLVPAIRQDLGFRKDKEFHYNRESDKTRKVLLNFLRNCEFQYVAVMVDKQRLNERDFAKRLSLRLQTVERLGELLTNCLKDATLVFDDFGGKKIPNPDPHNCSKNCKKIQSEWDQTGGISSFSFK